jgi:hypothetical protein
MRKKGTRFSSCLITFLNKNLLDFFWEGLGAFFGNPQNYFFKMISGD